MKIRGLMFAVLVFSGVIIGMTNFYSSLFINQGADEVKNLSTVSRMEDVRETSNMMQNQTLGEEPESESGIAGILWTQVTGGLNMLLSTATLPVTLMSDIMGLPSINSYVPMWAANMIRAGIMVVISFVFISAVRRWEI